MPEHRPPNRLINETSPYLLQHAHNPVDWFAWGPDALARARAQDKPIVLSIGYSACHWCHVMEHESFEDEQVARLMNELFICIKVDREERPDLDQIYQLVHQLLNRRGGGWPLTVFLTPVKHTPMFAGTYFPKQARYGMPGFPTVLRQVADHYRAHRNSFDDHHQAILAAFTHLAPNQAGQTAQPNAAWLDEARAQLEQQYDPVNGGFGDAPKFPHPASIERLLRHWARSRETGTGDGTALRMAIHTLTAMADGGLYDQLGGGFCRYTVDGNWTIPHFEKMLYDNALLLPLYADAAQATGEPQFAAIAAGTSAWVMREMQDPAGGFYSTLDADSEGEEGKYYVWTTGQIKDALEETEWALCRLHYGLDGTPNFERKWHLRIAMPLATAGAQLGLAPTAAAACLQRAHTRLLALRAQRVRPARDEKILTSWNGMMIKGMAHAGRLLHEPRLIASASQAFDFAHAVLWRNDRLFATTRTGKTHLNAYLDDYVWLIDAALELLQTRWRAADLEFAVALADATLAHFEDPDRGGFYFTADDHETLLHRTMPAADDATPSGNGIAASALLRLGHLLGEPRYLNAAERTLRALAGHIAGSPEAHNTLLNAVEESIYPIQIVVLRGMPAAMRPWLKRIAGAYAPRRMVFPIPTDAESLPGALAARVARSEVTAYLCIGSHCLAPFDDLDHLDAALQRPANEN